VVTGYPPTDSHQPTGSKPVLVTMSPRAHHYSHNHNLMIELMDPLSRYVTTGTFMTLAMTCHTLYKGIFEQLRLRVQICIKEPLSSQPILLMHCLHECSAKPTCHVYKLKGRVAIVYCTHCLYAYSRDYGKLPSSTVWMTPRHEVMVRKVICELGARHSLL
jgi:hypothetical protein